MRDNASEGREALPRADIEQRRKFSFIWIVPFIALAFVAWLMVRHYLERGPTVVIRFEEATGLEAGASEVQFRGAIIGLVSNIRLATDLRGVLVEVQLHNSATAVAREGSEFWIVQPQVTAERIHGLGAIVSGNYIEVKPGTGEKKLSFKGLEQPPILPYGAEGLEIVLLTPTLRSVPRGASVMYRGVKVGEVTRHELETTAQAVRLNVHIAPAYAPLVRADSKFWNISGVEVDVGLLGVDIRAESLRSIVLGGIALATPDPPGQRVKDGAVFRLHEKADEQWPKWAPNIPINPEPHAEREMNQKLPLER